MRTVIAIGGHALASPAPRSTSEPERAGDRIGEVARAIAKRLSDDALLITHGNGPQAGWLAAQSEAASGSRAGFDAITAQTEGLTGYALELALENALPDREIATLLTQVEIDPADPALSRPNKPVGRVFDDEEADCLRARGFVVGPDRRGFRRMVASPRPLRVMEQRAIARLLGDRGIVVCAGGGGIPVCRGEGGEWRGVDAVVDKDHTSGLLACEFGARRLFLLTDVPGVFPRWPERDVVLRSVDPAALAELAFSEGTMGPKVAAATSYAQHSTGTAWIGRVEELGAMIAGTAGTRISAGAEWLEVPSC